MPAPGLSHRRGPGKVASMVLLSPFLVWQLTLRFPANLSGWLRPDGFDLAQIVDEALFGHDLRLRTA